MERDMNQQALPVQCRSGCGFYGSPATDGLCSQCFKDTLKRKNDPGRISPSSAVSPLKDSSFQTVDFNLPSSSSGDKLTTLKPEPNVPSPCPSTSSSGTTATEESRDGEESSGGPQEPVKKKTNRCDTCRKKVGLTGFECRCGGLFCSTHRYSDMHQCSVDYKALGAEEIRKNNPLVMREKVEKI